MAFPHTQPNMMHMYCMVYDICNVIWLYCTVLHCTVSLTRCCAVSWLDGIVCPLGRSGPSFGDLLVVPSTRFALWTLCMGNPFLSSPLPPYRQRGLQHSVSTFLCCNHPAASTVYPRIRRRKRTPTGTHMCVSAIARREPEPALPSAPSSLNAI
jgi:hypothetical protein